MHWTDRRTRFREVLNGTRCVHPGSVYDATSIRIAEDLGFEVGMFGGSNWAPNLDNPQNKAFVAAYEKEYNAVPGSYAFQAYDAGLLIDGARLAIALVVALGELVGMAAIVARWRANDDDGSVHFTLAPTQPAGEPFTEEARTAIAGYLAGHQRGLVDARDAERLGLGEVAAAMESQRLVHGGLASRQAQAPRSRPDRLTRCPTAPRSPRLRPGSRLGQSR